MGIQRTLHKYVRKLMYVGSQTSIDFNISRLKKPKKML